MQTTINIVPAADANGQAIKALLQAEKLPVDDLPTAMDNFFIAVDGGIIIGTAGLELYGQFGLLRSLVVSPAYRTKNIAAKLIEAVEHKAKVLQLESVYLLTETAKNYFEKKGYVTAPRAEMPEAVKQSSEFSHVCPVSAVVMKKSIS